MCRSRWTRYDATSCCPQLHTGSFISTIRIHHLSIKDFSTACWVIDIHCVIFYETSLPYIVGFTRIFFVPRICVCVRVYGYKNLHLFVLLCLDFHVTAYSLSSLMHIYCNVQEENFKQY